MKLTICLIAMLTSISFISAAATDNHGNSSDLFDLVHRRASPQAILAFLNGSRLDDNFLYSFDYIKETLSHAIRSDQFETLQTLWPRITFPQDRFHKVIRQLLIVGILNHKPDACRFIISQVHRLENTDGVPEQLPIWLGMSSGWTAQELISLVEANPGYAVCFTGTANEMGLCDNVTIGLAMLQFNSHFASRDFDFAALDNTQPFALLRGLLSNFILDDMDMAHLTIRLCETGNAHVSHELVEEFEKSHADHVLTLQTLREWISVDVKVTEEESYNNSI
jgi:hypothetical protein